VVFPSLEPDRAGASVLISSGRARHAVPLLGRRTCLTKNPAQA
jgi:hypothetical protein